MRIALLSFVNNLNYGGSLQEYALESAVKKYGGQNISCEYLNYHRNFYKDAVIWLLRKILYRIIGRDDTPSWTIREFLQIVFAQRRAAPSDSAKEFEKFWLLTDFSRRLGRKELRRIEGAYDLFLAGSDQVWNCGRLNLDTTFLLDFVKCQNKKGSYASSVGMKKIPKKYRKQYLKYWSKIKYLSCRESEGAGLIQKLTGRKAEWVLDPVFLLEQEEWEKAADLSAVYEEPYVLLYMLDQSAGLVRLAKKLAQLKHRKLVKIYGDIEKNNAVGPKQWLGYFLWAEYIVTNSFHGTAFSIHFHKNFYVEITPQAFFTESSSRITDLLRELDLQDRVIGNAEEYAKKMQIETITDVLYEHADKKIAAMKQRSVKYLKNMLESCVDESNPVLSKGKESVRKKNNVSRIAKDQCVGCRACETICSAGAVKMKRNEEGFAYPAVSDRLCINCGKCAAYCPALHSQGQAVNPKGKTFAARCLDEEKLLRSSSGGIFGVMAEHCIRQNGVVYGVAFDKNYEVRYSRGEHLSDIERMRGSKYVDAFMPKSVIKDFLKDVSSARTILFTGTSCQIAGMKAVCRERRLKDENVWWIDFYKCSGKVSPLLWEEECKTYRAKGTIEAVSFRNKKYGWKTYSMYQRISGKDYRTDFLLHRWSRFLGNSLCCRRSCLNCRYSCGRSGADISIGDFWERMVLPERWRDNQGLSIVQVHTGKGERLFACMKKHMDYIEVEPLNDVKRESVIRQDQKKRRVFWNVYYARGYMELCRQYASVTWKDKFLFGKVRPLLIRLGLR